MNTANRIKPIAWSIALAGSLSAAQACAETESGQAGLEQVIVTGELRDTNQLDLPTSVTVLGEDAISARGAGNLDQLLGLAPNVNFAAGASRGRFIQIRGIGERSQFIDPVNPSVGLVIDGIDFTGLGLAASTLDMQQVEILRGPQGTAYGANALAGLVNMTSAAPTAEPMEKVSAEVAEYNGRTVSAVGSGALTDRLSIRLAARKQQSDGYIENDFLGRSDTNNIDESVLRGKLRYQASDDLQLDLTALHIDVDNGYDAFSLYNTRTTLSDQPGHDRQQTLAGSLVARWSGSELFTLESTLSAADSDTEYGYDEDWTYVGFHPWEYSSTDNYQRERDNLSADLRLLSTDASALFGGRTTWVAGAYFRDESEGLERKQSFTSQFDTQNSALYGQLRTALTETLALVTGLRLEKRTAEYADSLAVDSSNSENLWGGNVTLEYAYADDRLVYATVSRGYKAGGINGRIISASATNPAIGSDVFAFDTEHMLNYELGLKGAWLENRLQAQLAAFYQDRSDVQAKQSIFDPADFSFDDFLANAAGGATTGLEVELNYLATDSLRLFASAGWLDAEFVDFVSTSHVDARDDWNGIALAPVDLDGRDVAHAPNYQYFTGAEYAFTPSLLLRVEVEGKDSFYFSNSHDEKSIAYELLNARLTYRGNNWEASLWGRNLTDEDYYTRGFYFSNQFGNNPANGYAPEPYYQYGEPRVAGISGSYTF
ncbi:TonB-dependent receptor [Microbulbifer yueqingensis]|uniref:Outer membrane receptor proteins, mostly Fe transport n=1 Tax=Microbulbifer yueqingensis TaxID=658219 RepID=A0A1G9BFU3_9GAMM|nr:TonB-dependent receptor [Microbulbifer yueqingensis]SDK38341.1 Outer membrane receptor proteins, mostly Fe transport [Microbulbifer yueqingensis]